MLRAWLWEYLGGQMTEDVEGINLINRDMQILTRIL